MDSPEDVGMQQQLSCAGFGAAPEPIDRLFFAVRPDARAAAQMAMRMQELCSQQSILLEGHQSGIFAQR